MINLRNLTLCLGASAVLLSGSVATLVAAPSPKEKLEAAWTSKKLADLDDATYLAVKASPDDAVKIVEAAFALSDASMESAIVEAAIRALRDLESLTCEAWTSIVSAGVASSDETESKYLIADMAADLAPEGCETGGGFFGLAPVVPTANAEPVGGITNPVTTERVIEVETPAGGGGGGGGGPTIIIESPADEGTPTGGMGPAA